MKILLIAYGCEPNKGSEPGVGWNWAVNLAKDAEKEVHVITRSNNQKVIENYWNGACPTNLVFHYYDLNKPLLWAKHHGMPVNLYYALWLQGSSYLAKKKHKETVFDLAQHITFGVFRDASSLYRLKIPYVIGPVGGGETTPKRLLTLFSAKEIIKEYLRSLANRFALLNPFLIKTFNNATIILTKTKDTKQLLNKWNNKTYVNLEIGINSVDGFIKGNTTDTFLFVGRFTYWKGIKLVLMAFAEYVKKYPKSKLIFIGKGEMRKDIQDFATYNLIKENIEIIQWINQEELKQYYSSSKALVFPSLHDSSGNVVLEALSFGLPVICLDCGGPATVLGDTLKELVVDTKKKTVSNVVEGIVEKMEFISENEEYRKKISEKCINRAQEMLWHNTVSNCYKLIESIV